MVLFDIRELLIFTVRWLSVCDCGTSLFFCPHDKQFLSSLLLNHVNLFKLLLKQWSPLDPRRRCGPPGSNGKVAHKARKVQKVQIKSAPSLWSLNSAPPLWSIFVPALRPRKPPAPR